MSKDYDELLGAFEDKPTQAKPSGEPKKPNAAAPSRKTARRQVSMPDISSTKTTANRSTPPQRPAPKKQGTGVPPRPIKPIAPPMKNTNDNSKQDRSAYKGGVYFSNPPRDIGKEADRQRGVSSNQKSGAKPTRRKATYQNGSKKNNSGGKLQQKLRSKGFKNFLIMLAVIIGVSGILCFYGIRCINDILSINITEEKNDAVEISVKKGMTDEEVIDILHDNDLIYNKLFCKVFLKVFDVDGEYVEGVYTLTPSMGLEKMLSTMKTDFRNAETITLTFPEGWTAFQMAEKLEANGVCTASSFISTLRTIDFSDDYTFLSSLDNKEKRFCVLEGYMYPDTYEFYKGENASSVVRRFLDNFEKKWTEEYSKLAKEKDMTIDEIITLASVIQKEAATKDQMGKISSVLYNRLDKPNAFPLLQCDSTEDYLLKTIKPRLTSSVTDTERYIQYRDDYDTYNENCVGLPVGAIGNPGNDAIYAALKPDDTNYLYFRHDAKGGVYYANTYAEHEANGKKADKVK